MLIKNTYYLEMNRISKVFFFFLLSVIKTTRIEAKKESRVFMYKTILTYDFIEIIE